MMHDAQLERGIISAMVHDDQSLKIYQSLLDKRHFYDKKNRADFLAVQEGAMVEADIRDMVIENHEYYAQSLKEMQLKRMIYDSCGVLLTDIQNGKGLDEVLPKIHKLQDASSLDTNHKGLSIAEIEERQEHTRTFDPIFNSYDFGDFYEHAGCFKGQTEVIFGHPKHGKTAYAIYRAAGFLEAGNKGLYITMEDTHIKIKNKFEQQLGPNHSYKHNLFISDRSIGTKDLDDVCKFLRYHKVVDNIDFAVVDYIQRIPVKGLGANDEVARVVEASNRITDLANELDMLILLLAQPHRIDKGRRDYQMFPEVHDLHGSSAIEKDAFVATSIFRPNQVDSLCNFNHANELLDVTSPSGGKINRNSIFARQRLNREDEKSTKWMQLIHTDHGLRKPAYE